MSWYQNLEWDAGGRAVRRLILTLGVGLLLAFTSAAETEQQNPATPPAEPAAADAVAADSTATPPPRDGVWVIFFHDGSSCSDCDLLEAYISDVIEIDFEEELASGEITWRSMDFAPPEMQPLVEHYALDATTLVISYWVGGVEVSWKNLAEVWDLLEDPPALGALVHDEVRAYLNIH